MNKNYIIGDEVEILTNVSGHPVGSIGVITEVCTDGTYTVERGGKIKWHSDGGLAHAYKGRSFPQYEGRKVKYIDEDGNSLAFPLIVAGCDYNIGLTLSNISDLKEHWVCYHGPLSPARRKNDADDKKALEIWPEKFKRSVEMIRDGVFDVRNLRKIGCRAGSYGVGSCAFSL